MPRTNPEVRKPPAPRARGTPSPSSRRPRPWENRSELLRAVAGARGRGASRSARAARQRPAWVSRRPRRGPCGGSQRGVRATRESRADRVPPGRLRHPPAGAAPRPGGDRRQPQGAVRLLGHHHAPSRRPGLGAVRPSRSIPTAHRASERADVTDFSKGSMHRALFSDEPYGAIPRNPDDPYVRTHHRRRRHVVGSPVAACPVCADPGHADRDRHHGPDPVPRGPGHPAYELDGCLTHLRNAGKLDARGGIVVGELEGRRLARRPRGVHAGPVASRTCSRSCSGPLGIPCIYGLPIGHGKHHVTVPHGAHRHARCRRRHAGHRRGRHRRRLTPGAPGRAHPYPPSG